VGIEEGAQFTDLAFATPALRGRVGSPWRMAYDASLELLPGVIVPDAHVEFVFQTGAACATRLAEPASIRTSPRAMIYAQRHGALTLTPTGANAIVAFRTTPAVASVLLGRSLADCWDRPIDLADLIGPEADRLLDRLAGAAAGAQVAVLESWLLSRLACWGPDHERNLRLQRSLLWRSGGESMSALADDAGTTVRTLRRHFARHAGLSPKQWSMSGRILRACFWLSERRDLPIAQIALAAGFGDQAAFTNAFRRYVGMTPARLRAEPIVYCERPGS
jgi:AraC-like DNA-binding protein